MRHEIFSGVYYIVGPPDCFERRGTQSYWLHIQVRIAAPSLMICATARAEGLSDLTAWWTHTYSPSIFVSGTKPTTQLININIPLYIQFTSVLACLPILRICKDMYLSKKYSIVCSVEPSECLCKNSKPRETICTCLHTYIHTYSYIPISIHVHVCLYDSMYCG